MDVDVYSEIRKLIVTAIAIVLHVAVSSAFMWIYCTHFDLDMDIIARHAGLIVAGWTALLGITGLAIYLIAVPKLCLARHTLFVVLWAMFSIQIAVYTVDWFSVSFMGDTVTFGLFAKFAGQIADAMRLSPIPLPFIVLYVFALQCVAILAAGIYARCIGAGLAVLCAPMRRLSLPRGGVRGVVCGIGLLATGACPVPTACYLESNLRAPSAGEPIAGLALGPRAAVHTEASMPGSDIVRRQRDAYPKNVPFQKRNVILVFIDDLRADHMSLYGYTRPTTPFLDSLMKTGRLHPVDVALATHPSTTPSLRSLLTSRTVPAFRTDRLMLTDILYDQGYAVTFIVSGEWEEYETLKELFSRGVYTFMDGSDSSKYPIGDDRMVPDELAKLPPRGGTPSLMFISFLSPHAAGYRLKRFEVFTPASSTALVHGNASTRREYCNYYDNGIVQTDALLEQTFRILSEKGYLHNALVVIFSDHGEELGEHGEFGHGRELYQTSLRVPLLFYEEGPAAYANLSFASLLDVSPSILDRLGLPVPATFEGRSLRQGPTDRLVYHFTSRLGKVVSTAVTYNRAGRLYKYIRAAGRVRAYEEFFDLNRDPGERDNAIAYAQPDVLRYMRENLAAQYPAWQQQSDLPWPNVAPASAAAESTP